MSGDTLERLKLEARVVELEELLKREQEQHEKFCKDLQDGYGDAEVWARKDFIRAAAMRIYSAGDQFMNCAVAWESALSLWDAKPEDC